MKRIVGNLPFLAYAAGGVMLALWGPALWSVSPRTAAAAAAAATAAFALVHLSVRSAVRARRLAALLLCQDELLRQIAERLDLADRRADDLERRLEAVPDAGAMDEVKGALQDLAAMLTARAATATAPRTAGGATLVREAVAQGRIDLHVQPIVRLPERVAAHADALSRVHGPDGRAVLPGGIPPSALSGGLASAVDELQIANCIAHLRAERRPGVRLFCGLSAASLGDPSFVAALVRRMAGAGDLAGALVFELNAGDLDSLGNAARAGLAELAGLGFELSIDDYVPGSAAGRALRGLRFAKCDADAIAAAGQAMLVEAREAGVELIATRVETERQVGQLERLGVRFGQGYLFGRPQPVRGPAVTEAA